MSQSLLSPRNLLAVAVTAVAGFLLFSLGLAAAAAAAGQPRSLDVATITIRFVVAVVMATVMLVAERRRQNPSVREAIESGTEMAVLCVAMLVIPGTAHFGIEMALRAATILIGLPLLEVGMHLMTRRSDGTPE
ncbi:MAG: hypothetical protein AABZ80_05350 [Gemmatimonadota bacterium]